MKRASFEPLHVLATIATEARMTDRLESIKLIQPGDMRRLLMDSSLSDDGFKYSAT